MIRSRSRLIRRPARALALLALTTQACTGPNGGARSESEAFLDAVAQERWKDAGTLLDLAQLESLRIERATAERQRRRSPPVTVEQLMHSNPDMPRSAAEYQITQTTRQRSQSLLKFEFGLSDPDSLLSLPIETVAARWVEVHDERWQNGEAHRNCPKDGRDDDIIAPAFQIIGTVSDSNRAYVLYSDTLWQRGIDPVFAPPPRVIQLRLRGQRWQILPRGDLIGLPDMVIACG